MLLTKDRNKKIRKQFHSPTAAKRRMKNPRLNLPKEVKRPVCRKLQYMIEEKEIKNNTKRWKIYDGWIRKVNIVKMTSTQSNLQFNIIISNYQWHF